LRENENDAILGESSTRLQSGFAHLNPTRERAIRRIRKPRKRHRRILTHHTFSRFPHVIHHHSRARRSKVSRILEEKLSKIGASFVVDVNNERRE
jgi:hypothetical protein